MDIVNIKVTFEDQFSGAKMVKEVTRSKDTFDKMQKSIGQIIHQFENNIRYEWKVISTEKV